MMKGLLITNIFLFFGACLLCLHWAGQPQASSDHEYYKHRCEILEAELHRQLDPLYRLKLIAGIKGEGALTWKEKVINNIDTKALTKHNPLDVWCRDDDTGTWNKPDSFN